MKKTLLQVSIILMVLTLFVILGCGKQGKVENVEADISAINSILDQYASSINDKNLDLWISLWVEDGIQMPPNAPAVIGKGQIRENNKSLFLEFTPRMVVTKKEVRVAGDLAFARGTYTLSLTPMSAGETIEIDGKYLSIMEKQADGSWKLARDCFNDNAPPKSEPAPIKD